uniref:tRNA nucleotidyltransferase, putative n=1 Tax=Theileria parva TaxID=5875 RepID=Q4MZK9_THEPA|eukprot:XP_763535.1 tRNA nucleotidyltransferase [Theileria parva strain Muguga]
MHKNVLLINFSKCIGLIFYILLIFDSLTVKSYVKWDFCKITNHEMSNIIFNNIKNSLNKLEISNFVNVFQFKSKNFILPVYAFRESKLRPLFRPIFTSGTHYTNNYNKFLKLSNVDVNMTDTTVSLDLDVYRNYTDKSGRAKFKITESENRLFNLLNECVDFYDLQMDLRVVGGWVRDKLLDKNNKDIDIAIPKMTGIKFCEYLNNFTKDKYGFSRTVGVVKRCPEQSKHLETATMNLLGFDVDFVNLRTEDYSSNTRIPDMKIGTPLEDAMRRDFTVNSLFYNISKNFIEDFTGTGLEDLKNGIIRTCSSPFETFMDDPLRLIRAVRFSSRFNFELDEKLTDSINEQVLKALSQKVTRPRISQEIENILLKSDVSEAFNLMYKFKILHVLLNVPPYDYDEEEKKRMKRQITDDMLTKSCSLMERLKKSKFPEIDYKCLYLSALVTPTRELPPIGKMSVAEYLVKELLKLSNQYSSRSHTISQGSVTFAKFLDDSKVDRVSLGSVIRSIGPLWKESLLLCLAELDKDYKVYNELVPLANDLRITEAYNFKAPITGQELMDLLPKITSGPEFKKALEFQVTERLKNENINKDELKDKLKSHFSNFL